MKIIIIFFLYFSVQILSQTIGLPPGTILAYSGDKDSLILHYGNDWRICDGSSIDIANYSELFKFIGWTYGYGAGGLENRTTFSLPDYRGYFLRGVDDNFSNRDPDRENRKEHFNKDVFNSNVGSVQDCSTALPKKNNFIADYDENRMANKDMYMLIDSRVANGTGSSIENGCNNQCGVAARIKVKEVFNHNHVLSGGDLETRPSNVYVYYIIKIR